jgi:deferrochelatase/peroxidase EfeB
MQHTDTDHDVMIHIAAADRDTSQVAARRQKRLEALAQR